MPVTAALLEDRINQYINAVDKASSANDTHQISQLQRDIQQLVDLMERINSGGTVPESVVPPPLAIAPQIDVLANPMKELSSRLANYHKALYFAEEELSDRRMHKIQMLQQCLQILNELLKNAEAGFPVRIDEVPPPVPIPSDEEFDSNAVDTLTKRISSYKAALLTLEQSKSVNDKKHVPKLQSALRTLEFLMTRAKANRPVWKRDIPSEYEYHEPVLEKQDSKISHAKFTLMLKSQLIRATEIKFNSPELQQKVSELQQELKNLLMKVSSQNADSQHNALLVVLTKQTEELEKLTLSEMQSLSNIQNSGLTNLSSEECSTSPSNGISQSHKLTKAKVSPQTTLEDSPYSPETKTVPVSSASAHLSPLPPPPAVDTQENQLAKKLSQYLENGDEREVFEQTTIFASKNLTQTQTGGLIPKVHNAFRNKPDMPVAQGHVNDKEEKYFEHQLHTNQTSVNEGKSLVESHSEDFLSTQNQNKQQDINRPTGVPHLLSGSSREIFTRNTLDSVGFLPCQNISHDQGTQSTKVSSPSEKMISKQRHFENKSIFKNRDTFGFPELNLHDSIYKNDGLSSLNLSMAHSEDLFHNKYSSLPIVLNHSGDTQSIFPQVNTALKDDVTTSLPTIDNQLSHLVLPVSDETTSLQNTVDKNSQADTLEDNSLSKQTNDSSSNDSSEFQDLLSSMTMPSLLVNNSPANTSVTLAAHTSSSLQSNLPDSQTYLRHKSSSVHGLMLECSSSCNDDLPSVKSNTMSTNVTLTGLPYVNMPSADQVTSQAIQQSAQPISQTENYNLDELDSRNCKIEFTCLENLKYDFLIIETKPNTPESRQEALFLRHRFDIIRQNLSSGDIQIWEEYKACVEGELSSFIKQIENLMLHSKWTEVKILRDKKRIAERELAVLRERLPELKF